MGAMAIALEQPAPAPQQTEDPAFTAFAAAYTAGWVAEAVVQSLAARIEKGRAVVQTQPQWAVHLASLEQQHTAVAVYWEARCRLVAAETAQETADGREGGNA